MWERFLHNSYHIRNSHDVQIHVTVSADAEESSLLRTVTKQRLVKTLQAGEEDFLACSDLQSVEISVSVVVICSGQLICSPIQTPSIVTPINSDNILILISQDC
jgi:hypothetical protein